jgi:tRNA threonylcarbamoyladenosine biosynthesis protein TsaB
MKLLAIETSTEACSIALACDGDIRERFEIAPRRHAELLLPWIDQMLAEAGVAKSTLDAIAVGRGPGAFTGVRLGIAVAQGIAFALQRPLLPVSTLAALAIGAGAAEGERVLAAIDARMSEIYLGAFVIGADELPDAIDDEQLCPPDRAVIAQDMDWIGIGSGFAAYEAGLRALAGPRLQRIDANALPRAASVARLGLRGWQRGEAIDPAMIEPAYLRDKVAQTLVERGVG